MKKRLVNIVAIFLSFAGILTYSIMPVMAVKDSVKDFFNAAKTNAGAEDSLTPDKTIYEDILNDRYWVVDTFTSDQLPETNPHASAQGFGNQDYMFTDILSEYENNKMIKAGVDVYYRIEHKGETILTIPSDLVDYFANGQSWTNFLKGAKNKNYDAVLNSVFSSDYTSRSGVSMASDLGDLQYIKTANDYSKKIKDKISDSDDFISYIGTLNSDYQHHMVEKYLPGYTDSVRSYISGVDDILNNAQANTGKEKETFDDLNEAHRIAMYKGKYPEDEEWMSDINTSKLGNLSGPFLSLIKKSASGVKGTTEKFLLLESMLGQREQMRKSLNRTRDKAVEKGDNSFARVSKEYIDLLNKEDLSDTDKEVWASVYLHLMDEIQGNVESLAGDTEDALEKALAMKIIGYNDANKLATSLFISSQLASLSNIFEITTGVGDAVTGFGTRCEKTYEIKYLKKIREYAIDVYKADEDAYKEGKRAGKSDEELNKLAEKALDDLYLLKRLTLCANEIGYEACSGTADAYLGDFISWIDGCSDSADINNRYNNIQGVIVDTLINPISNAPINVGSGQTLRVIKNNTGVHMTIRTNGVDTFGFGEPEYRLLGGIALLGGSVEFMNSTSEDIYVGKIYAGSGTSSMIISGTGGVTTSLLGSIRSKGVSASLNISGESENCGSVTTTIFNNDGTIKVDGIDLNIEKNVVLDENSYLDVRNNTIIAGGDWVLLSDSYMGAQNVAMDVAGDYRVNGFRRNDSRGLAFSNSVDLKIGGDMVFNNTASGYYGPDSEYGKIASLYGTSIELKGDFIDESQVNYGWEGYPNIKLTGEGVQTLDYRSYLESITLNKIGTFEVYCPAIKVNNELAVGTLGTDVKIDSNVPSLCITSIVEGKTIEITGSSTVGRANTSAGSRQFKMGSGSRLDCGGSFTVENKGQAFFSDGATAEFSGDMKVLTDSYLDVRSSSVDIGGDFRVEGYRYVEETSTPTGSYRSGTYCDNASSLKIGGDMTFKNESSSADYMYIASLYGTAVELKGDLIDESQSKYGWAGGLNLKLTGDQTQKIDCRPYDGSSGYFDWISSLKSACPGIYLDKNIPISSLLSDVVITGKPKTVSFTYWNSCTVTLSGVSQIPSISLPSGYSMYISLEDKESRTYNAVYKPTNETTYRVSYWINGSISKTLYNYSAGSLIVPYEMMTGTSKAYEWFKDGKYTDPLDICEETVSGNMDIYGLELTQLISRLRNELTQLLQTAAEIEETCYTEDSYAVLTQAVQNAESILGDEAAGKEDLTVARDNLRGAIEGLEEVVCSHKLTILERVEPDCVADGHIEYWYCDLCGMLFIDEEGEKEIEPEDTVIQALGHQIIRVEKTEPTYDEFGYEEHWTCTRCGRVFTDAEGTDETTLEALSIPRLEKDATQQSADEAINASGQANDDAQIEYLEALSQTEDAINSAESDEPDDSIIEEAVTAADEAVEYAFTALDAAEKALEAVKTAYGEDSDQAITAESMVADARSLVVASTASKATAAKAAAINAGKKADGAGYAAAAAASTPGAAAVNAAQTSREAALTAAVKADEYKEAAEAALEAAEAALEIASEENIESAQAAVMAAQDAVADADTIVAEANARVTTADTALSEAEAAKKKADALDLAKTKAGTTHTDKVSGGRFKVLKNVAGKTPGTVALIKSKNVRSITVPATVKLNGKTFKVTQISAKALLGSKIRTVTVGTNIKTIKKDAFKGSKATKLIIKTRLLTKSGVKGSLRGSKIKTVQVKVGTKAVNKKYVKKYKTLFTTKNAGRKVTVK